MKVLLIFISIIFIGCFSSYNLDNIKIKAKINEKLKDAYNKYWYFIIHKEYKKAYEMESPDIRFLLNFKKYKSFVSTYNLKNKRIEVIGVDKKGNNYYIKEIINGVLVKDRWVKVEGKFYHVFYDALFFKY